MKETYTEEELVRAKEMAKIIFQLGEEREYGCTPDTWFEDDTEKLYELRNIIIAEFKELWWDENYDRGENDLNAIDWIDNYSL